jgi:hypothetical protein
MRRRSPYCFGRLRPETQRICNWDNMRTTYLANSILQSLNTGLGSGAGSGGRAVSDSAASMHCGSLTCGLRGAARIARGLDLFRSPQIGLRGLDVFFRSGNFALVAF